MISKHHIVTGIVLIFFFAWTSSTKTEESTHPTVPVDENAEKFRHGGCDFYCFFVPKYEDKEINVSFNANVSCSHLVYGWATVRDDDIMLPTRNDFTPGSYYGNFKFITSLRESPVNMKVLLGIRQAKGTEFLDNDKLRKLTIDRLVFYTRRYSFDGMFLKFSYEKLHSPGMEKFFDELTVALDNDVAHYKKLDRLMVVLSIGGKWAQYFYRKMPRFDRQVSAFYLWSDETQASEHIYDKKVPLEPLFHVKGHFNSESIAENAERLALSGVSRRKIIIGFSAFPRNFTPESDEAREQRERAQRLSWFHGDQKRPSYLAENEVGKTSFQSLCFLRNGTKILSTHDNTSYFTHWEDEKVTKSWFSWNEPESKPFQAKLRWVSSREFGGVGLYNIQADDPENKCRYGLLPLHRYIGQNFVCKRFRKRSSKANGKTGAAAASVFSDRCVRLCQIDLDRLPPEVAKSFTFDMLKPGWCSHLAVGYGELTMQPSSLYVYQSPGLQNAVRLYRNWSLPAENRPELVITIGGLSHTSEQWRLFLSSPVRQQFIHGIRKLVDSTGADGVELNWTNGKMNWPDRDVLNTFLKELRGSHGLPEGTKVFLSVSPSNVLSTYSFDSPYDWPSINPSVDYIILQGWGFHQADAQNTGHHSPLFRNKELLNDPSKSIEGVTDNFLTKNVSLSKVIIGLSAIPMQMMFRAENASMQSRQIGDSALNDPASVAALQKSGQNTNTSVVDSQSKICEIRDGDRSDVSVRFLEGIGVPYLVYDRYFVAYDDARSVAIKSVWASMHGFVGLALHGLEADDVGGRCASGKPFPLLRAMYNSQVCDLCSATDKESEKTPTSIDSNEFSGNNQTTNDQQQNTENQQDPNKTLISSFNVTGYRTDRMNYVAQIFGLNYTTTISPAVTGKLCGSTRPVSGSMHASGARVSCSYRLPNQRTDTGDDLDIDLVPFKRCDEIVVEETLLDSGPRLEFKHHPEYADKQIEELREHAIAAGMRQLVVLIQCYDTREDFVKLITESSEKVVKLIQKLVEDHGFSGIELACDHYVDSSTKDAFGRLLTSLQSAFSEKQSKDGVEECPKTISLRIPVWNTNLSLGYDIALLNSLSGHVVIEALHHNHLIERIGNHTQLINPLFADWEFDQDVDGNVQSSTVEAWLASGLNSEKIYMQLPMYGVHQLLPHRGQQDAPRPGDPARNRVRLISQRTVCQFKRGMGVTAHTLFERVSEYAANKHDWVSYEGHQSITYKARFAAQHRLGGLSIQALNDDDWKELCHEGTFPLLDSVNAALCMAPVKAE